MKENGFVQKKKIGILLPSVQTVTEPLFNRLLGDRFDFHAQRVRLLGGEVSDLVEMEGRVPSEVCALKDAHVDLIAYCCAGSGAILGKESELSLCREIENDFGIPMISSMDCCTEALKSIGAKKITMIGPNAENVSHTEIEYLEKDGIEVISHYGFGIIDGSRFSQISPEEIKQKALSNWEDSSDAMFMACMNWHATEVMNEISSEIKKPVVTSHSAVLWKAYCMLEQEVTHTEFVHLLKD